MRGAATAFAAVLLGSLGCALLGDPPAELHNVRAGTCAEIVGEATGHGELVKLTLDGKEVEFTVPPRDGSPGEFRFPASPGAHVVSHLDSDVDHPVTVPMPVVEASWEGFARPFREGQRVDPIALKLVSACPTAMLTADVTLDGSPVLSGVPERELTFGVGEPKAGEHSLDLTFYVDGAEAGRQQLTFEIGPPCEDKACKDADGDGHASTEFGGKDCDDTNPDIHPGARRFPDPDGDGAFASLALDYDCDGDVEHADAGTKLDCDETDSRIPRDEELEPTGVDEDCDGLVDEGTRVYDDDGDGASEDDGDCRDDDPTVRPGRTEKADCKDNDCDGEIDEGVTRKEADDPFEPNDSRPWALKGAKKKTGFFGGYHTTSESVRLVLRDAGDVETFTLFAHDGTLDHFHVTVALDSIGDGLEYDVRVTGPNSSRTTFRPSRGVAGTKGLEKTKLVTLGRGFSSDTGEYTIRVKPKGTHPDWCPLKLTISSG